MSKVALIVPSGEHQQRLFWSSYLKCNSGHPHDLILIHRDNLGVPENPINNDGDLILENKIINGEDIPHRAFGAYRHYYYKYQNDYDYFVFISDDVVFRSDNWLKRIVDTLNLHEKIGFGASQIFNGHKKYPHESHLRAPFWFAKSEVLKKIDWQFDSDHDGEMKIGDQCTSVGYVGVQVGNKINLAYDSTEPNHITQILENTYYPGLNPFGKHSVNVPDLFEDYIELLNSADLIDEKIVSPYPHIGEQNAIIDIEPFHGLIYFPSLENANKYSLVKTYNHDINLLCPTLRKLTVF
jgi:hypothetical protein